MWTELGHAPSKGPSDFHEASFNKKKPVPEEIKEAFREVMAPITSVVGRAFTELYENLVIY